VTKATPNVASILTTYVGTSPLNALSAMELCKQYGVPTGFIRQVSPTLSIQPNPLSPVPQ
jgi:hypothetical protein